MADGQGQQVNIDPGQLAQGMMAGLQQLLPQLMQGLSANPYTMRGFQAINNMGPAAAQVLMNQFGGIPGAADVAQGMMGRAMFMHNLMGVGFPGGQGPLGYGFGQAQREQIFQMARAEAPQATVTELAQIVGAGAGMGQFNAVRDVREFRDKFRQMLNAVKEITQTLGTSLDESLALMQQMKSMGAMSPMGQARMSQFIGNVAYAGGLDPRAVAGGMGAMIPSLRQAGGFGQQTAAMAAGNFMGYAGIGQMQGWLSDTALQSATGETGGAGMAALMGQYLPRAAQRLAHTGRGAYFTAAMIDPTTGMADPEMLMRARTGQLGMNEVGREGRRRAGQIGQARWMQQRGRFAGEVMSQEPLIELMMIRNAMTERGITEIENDPRARIMMSRMTGARDEELDALLPLVSHVNDLRMARDIAKNQQSQAQRTARQQQVAQPDWLRNLQSKMQQYGQQAEQLGVDLSTQLENYMYSRAQNALGAFETWIRPDTQAAAFGGGPGGAPQLIQHLQQASQVAMSAASRLGAGGGPQVPAGLGGGTADFQARAGAMYGSLIDTPSFFGAGGAAGASGRMDQLRRTDRGRYEEVMARSRLATETITAMGGAGQLKPGQMPQPADFAGFKRLAERALTSNPSAAAREMGYDLFRSGYLTVDPAMMEKMRRGEPVEEEIIENGRPTGRFRGLSTYQYTGDSPGKYKVTILGQEYEYSIGKGARMNARELYADILQQTIFKSENQRHTFDVLSALSNTSEGYGAAYANEIATAAQGGSYQDQKRLLNRLTQDMASRAGVDRITQRVAENFARGNVDVLSGLYGKMNEASKFISDRNNLTALDSATSDSAGRKGQFIRTMSRWMSSDQAANLADRADIAGLLREPGGVGKAVEFSVRGAMVSGLSENVALGEMGARVYGIQDITQYTTNIRGGALGSGAGLRAVQALADVSTRGGGWGDYQTAFAGLEKFALAGGTVAGVSAVAEELRARGDAAAADLLEQGAGRAAAAKEGKLGRGGLVGMLQELGQGEGLGRQGRRASNEDLIARTERAFNISSDEARKIVVNHGKGVTEATVQAMTQRLRDSAAQRGVVGESAKQREAQARKQEMAEAFRDGLDLYKGTLQVEIKGGLAGLLLGSPPGTEGTDETGGGSATGSAAPPAPQPPR